MPTGLTVRKYAGVAWALFEAVHAQNNGATMTEAQAYLDYCESHSVSGPSYGYQQWKAIFRANNSQGVISAV
jgi:hypothetical protein